MSSQDTNKKKTSYQGICDIIRACKDSNVKVLKYQGLELYFIKPEETKNLIIPEKELKESVHHAEAIDMVEEVDRDLELLAIEDPLAYEEFVNSEQATEGDSERYRSTE